MSVEFAPYALDPFGPSANPTAYVACEASERARAELWRAVEASRVAAVVGPPGHGKTLLLRLLGADLESRARVAYVPMCDFEPDDLFALALHSLGLAVADDPRAALVGLARRLESRGGVALLVDDAHAMPEATARALEALRRETGGALRLVFAAIDRVDGRRWSDAFGDALDVVRLDTGLSLDETQRYLETRLAYAGARPELVDAFDEGTVAELHRKTDGVPREINQAAQHVVRRASLAASPPRLRSDSRPPAPPERRDETDGDRDAERGIFVAPLSELFVRPPDAGAGAYRIVRPHAAAPPRSERSDDPAGAEPSSEARAPRVPDARRALVHDAEPRGLLAALSHVPLLPLAGCVVALGILALGMWVVSSDDSTREARRAERAVQPSSVVEPDPTWTPAERDAPAASAAAPIAIAINATPWAVIEVDDREVGTTPLTAEIAPGRHHFRARMADGSVREQWIEITSDVRTVVFE